MRISNGSERMVGCKTKQKRYEVSCSSIGMCQEKRLEWALKHPESIAFKKAHKNFNFQRKEDEPCHRTKERGEMEEQTEEQKELQTDVQVAGAAVAKAPG